MMDTSQNAASDDGGCCTRKNSIEIRIITALRMPHEEKFGREWSSFRRRATRASRGGMELTFARNRQRSELRDHRRPGGPEPYLPTELRKRSQGGTLYVPKFPRSTLIKTSAPITLERGRRATVGQTGEQGRTIRLPLVSACLPRSRSMAHAEGSLVGSCPAKGHRPRILFSIGNHSRRFPVIPPAERLSSY